MKKIQNSSRSVRFGFMLAGFILTSTLFRASAGTLQTFDRLFQGDDPTEGFDFSLAPDPATQSLIRFSGFAENRDTFSETGVRFWLAWPTNAPDYRLEYVATHSATNWTTLTNTVGVAGGNFSVTVDGTDAQRFYRLRR